MALRPEGPDALYQAHVTIKGVSFLRVKYGGETDDWSADRGPCHDCGVMKGELHVWGCDVERCPACGGQLIFCECDD
jgi:rRNA maturation endonuclease Nob1